MFIPSGISGNCVADYDMNNYKWVYRGLLNNIDGGMPFWPGLVDYDGYAYQIVDPMKLKETYEHNRKSGYEANPEKLQNLEKQIISNISDLSNPIIMKVK